jgi:hypothetical protein
VDIGSIKVYQERVNLKAWIQLRKNGALFPWHGIFEGCMH